MTPVAWDPVARLRRSLSGASQAALGILAAVSHVAGCAPADSLPTRSFTLPAPELVEPAFEPHLSMDPGDPDRIVVAAHYGIGYNRGGRKIWAWHTDDAGKTWTGANIPLPAANAALAADAVTSFSPDGGAYLAFLFADTTALEFQGGLALARRRPEAPGFGPAETVARGGLRSPARAAIDKGWLSVDGGKGSPHRGTLYLTWHQNRPDPLAGTVHSTLWLTASRNGGETFADPLWLADAFHGQVAVRPDGTVDVLYGTSASTLLHVASTDAGLTFSEPDTVARLGDSTTVDVPHLSVTGRGTLLACWSEAARSKPKRYVSRCARSADGTSWDPPADVAPALPSGSSLGFPVTASGGGATWLLAYRADTDTTRVLLLRSPDDGRTFVTVRELASRPIGAARFCIAAGAPCRRAEGVFFPGDYFGLAAVGDRVAAAFVLPEGNDPTDRATVQISLIHGADR